MPRSKFRVSYIIKPDYTSYHHSSGLNSLALDSTTITNAPDCTGGIIYTAGRDSIVNAWNLHLPFSTLSSEAKEPSEFAD